MSEKTNEALSASKKEKSVLEPLAEPALDSMLEIAQMLQELISKGTLSEADKQVINDFRAGMEIIGAEIAKAELINNGKEDVREDAKDLLKTPSVDSSISGELSSEEVDIFERAFNAIEQQLEATSDAIYLQDKIVGVPDHPFSAKNKQELLRIARDLANKNGACIAAVRGAELENGGRNQHEQLVIEIVRQMKLADTLLSLVRGGREGEWANEGAMNLTRGLAVARNLCYVILKEYDVLQALNVEASKSSVLLPIVKNATRVGDDIKRKDAEKISEKGIREEDFTGGFNVRRKAYRRKGA